LYPKHPHRFGDVLDCLLAQILITKRQLVLDLVVDGPRNADAPRLRQPFQSGRDVDPIAIDLLSLHHHIAHVNADAKLHLACGGQLSVSRFERALNRDRTLHGIDRTGELGQEIIPGRVHHSAAVLRDEGSHHLAVSSEGADRRFLILPHEAAVAFDIGAENGGELAFHTHPPRERLSC
jgi:hypothetical protein